ncbi:MAG: hypothetical protein LBE35_04285 [Clostridiales bacterium]|jgi:chromosome segregation ATPase|nr:hypothetical protein [Clostridiales bacterium]
MNKDDKILMILEGLDQKVSGLDQKFNGLDLKFNGLDEKFSGLDEKVNGLDEKVSGLTEAVKELKDEQIHLGRRMDKNEREITGLTIRAGTAFNKLELMDTDLYKMRQRFEEGFGELEAGQAKLEAGQAKLEAGQAEIKAEVETFTGIVIRAEAELKLRMVATEDSQKMRDDIVKEIRADVKAIKGRERRRDDKVFSIEDRLVKVGG